MLYSLRGVCGSVENGAATNTIPLPDLNRVGRCASGEEIVSCRRISTVKHPFEGQCTNRGILSEAITTIPTTITVYVGDCNIFSTRQRDLETASE